MSLRGILGRDQRVVDLLRPPRGWTGAQAFRVSLESRAFFQRAEGHSPHDVRAKIDVRRRELISEQVISLRYGAFEGVEHVFEAAVAGHPPPILCDDEAERLVG